jgi:hypothetical protein
MFDKKWQRVPWYTVLLRVYWRIFLTLLRIWNWWNDDHNINDWKEMITLHFFWSKKHNNKESVIVISPGEYWNDLCQ